MHLNEAAFILACLSSACRCLCLHLAPSGVQVVAVGGEEQVCEASVVSGRQQSQQGAILAGVEAGAAGIRSTGINRQAGAEAKAGDDAALALLLHCGDKERASKLLFMSTQSRLCGSLVTITAVTEQVDLSDTHICFTFRVYLLPRQF